MWKIHWFVRSESYSWSNSSIVRVKVKAFKRLCARDTQQSMTWAVNHYENKRLKSRKTSMQLQSRWEKGKVGAPLKGKDKVL